MATFAKSLESKLKTLEATQTGIQTLSLWIIHHRHHADIITGAWRERVKKVPRSDKRLGLFYLANDVVQNGRKKAKDLVLAFGKAFYEVMPLYSGEKTKPQVERVFNIWIERNVYDADFIAKLRSKLVESKVKSPSKPAKLETSLAKPEKSPAKSDKSTAKPIPEVEEKKKAVVTKPRKVVPPEFRVANLLVSIKKSTSLESEVNRKSKKLDNLKIDASSYDSVKHVKDRSSVGKFHKQFEESKIILDDYIHTLRRTEKDKRNLMNLLNAGEAFYSLAQDEAKVIVNAYNTFGDRLNSMKRKLDAKIKIMESGGEFSPQKDSSVNQASAERTRSRDNSAGSIQDMDLDSDSGDEIPASETYNPSTAPIHDENQQSGSLEQQQQQRNTHSMSQSDFFNPQINGMSSFLPFMNPMSQTINTLNLPTVGPGVQELQRPTSVTTPISDKSAETPDELIIADDPFGVTSVGFMQNDVTSSYGAVSLGNNTITNTAVSDGSMRVQQELHKSNSNSDKNPAVQNLIDSLFPVLSKSLQTIKEKTLAAEEKPSVTAAMAFALGEPVEGGENIARKKQKMDTIDGSSAISPVSLTNPKGLSEHQEELINIAAGLTEFDENFLPVTKESSLSRSQSYEDEQRKEKGDKDDEKKRDEKRPSSSSGSSGRHRQRSHKESTSGRSPQRRSSYRSSRDGREERRSDKRRSSRHSPSPRRRKGSRGGRSSSKERDDKRKHSPESATKNVYYNNRRSPTPEMDSSSSSQFPQQNVLPGQQPMIPGSQQNPVISGPPPVIPGQPPMIVNPIIQNQRFQVPSTGQPPNADNNPPTFVNQQGIVINPQLGMFPEQHKQHQQQQNMNTQENNNNSNDLRTDRTIDQSHAIPHSHQNQAVIGQMPNNFQIRPPAIMPGHMNFDMNIRPTPQLRIPGILPANPLHLLQQRIDDPKPLPFQQLGPRVVSFNQPPQFVPVGIQNNHNITNQDNLSNAQEHQGNIEHSDKEDSQHKDAEHQPQDTNVQQPSQFLSSFDVHNPPPFPGAPPMPPPFMRPLFPQPGNMNVFNPGAPPTRFVNAEMKPPMDGTELLKLRPGFGPDQIRPIDQIHPMDMGIRQRFNAVDFEPRHHEIRQPRFQPRFHQNSPGRPVFRPRTRFVRPPHRQQRPML